MMQSSTVSDASWANEEKIIDEHIFPRRSQYGRFNCLGHPDLWDGEEGAIHFIGWKSGLIKRMCRSTFRAETQGMSYAQEVGVHLRAALSELHGTFSYKNWEGETAKTCQHVWFTDCESLHSYLINPVAAGCEDKRLEIDLLDLRQLLWEDHHGNPKDSMQENQTDKILWIDTSTMLADPLTKAMAGVARDHLFAKCGLVFVSGRAASQKELVR